MTLAGKVAIITGSTGGLGCAVTAAFLEAGARVLGTWFVEDELATLKARVGEPEALHLVRANLTQPTDADTVVAAACEQFGGVDIVVNLVGGWAGGAPLHKEDPGTLGTLLAINVQTAYEMCRAAVPALLERGGGRIITVSARPALKPGKRQLSYATAKGAVLTLTHNLAEELRDRGVAVNAVLPSIIDTPANRAMMPDADFDKWVKPEQIANVILFLASDDAAIISGAAIPVYGRA